MCNDFYIDHAPYKRKDVEVILVDLNNIAGDDLLKVAEICDVMTKYFEKVRKTFEKYPTAEIFYCQELKWWKAYKGVVNALVQIPKYYDYLLGLSKKG